MDFDFDQDDSRRSFLCPHCCSELVQPVEWAPLGRRSWSILVRCPECFQFGDLRLDECQADFFISDLDIASEALEEAADTLGLDLFRVDCETFVQALESGLITPMDF